MAPCQSKHRRTRGKGHHVNPCLDSRLILSSARANRQWRSMWTAYGRQVSTKIADFCYVPGSTAVLASGQSLGREPGMNQSQQTTALRVRRASEIEASGDPAVAADRYLIESLDSGGLVALVEHIVGPHVLAAPVPAQP